MRLFGSMAIKPGQFGFEARNRTVQSLSLARNIALRKRRIQIVQLREQRLARPLINRAPDLRRRIRQASDGLCKQRIIFSHFALRAFPDPSVNWRRALRRSRCMTRSIARLIHATEEIGSISKTENISFSKKSTKFIKTCSSDHEKDYGPGSYPRARGSSRAAQPEPRSTPRCGAHI